MTSPLKRKGCGPQSLGTPNKMISRIAKAASKAKEIDQAYRKEAADAKNDPDYLKFMADNSATPMLASPLAFKGANSSNSSCWRGCKKVGEKESDTRPGVMVNDCDCD